jgi:uncharacterized membrane protein
MSEIKTIATLTDEEISELDKKLGRKIIINKIIIPVATTLVLHVVTNIIIKKLDKSDNSA